MFHCRFSLGKIVLLTGMAVMALAGNFPSQAAADPGFPPYVVHSWRTDDGLPQNAVTSVVQTKDGYVWVGTYGGLARFDGVHFRVFNSGNTPALRSGRVTSLFEDRAGTLWIGSEIGELTTYDPISHFRAVAISSGFGRRKIIGIRPDEAGDIWLADAAGVLLRVKDGLRLEPKSGLALNLAGMAGDSNGTIWVQRNGLASTLEQGRLSSQRWGRSIHDVRPRDLFGSPRRVLGGQRRPTLARGCREGAPFA